MAAAVPAPEAQKPPEPLFNPNTPEGALIQAFARASGQIPEMDQIWTRLDQEWDDALATATDTEQVRNDRVNPAFRRELAQYEKLREMRDRLKALIDSLTTVHTKMYRDLEALREGPGEQMAITFLGHKKGLRLAAYLHHGLGTSPYFNQARAKIAAEKTPNK